MNYKPSKNSGFTQFDVKVDLLSKSHKTLASQSWNKSKLSIHRQDNLSLDLAKGPPFQKSGNDIAGVLYKPMHNRGFTLVELMVTVAIVGILTSVGVPSFIEMINQNRATSLANELAASLNLARSEAIKRGLQVSICKSANISDSVTAANVLCSTATSTSWKNGWLIFVDNKGTPGTYDYNASQPLSDTLLKIVQLSTSNAVIYAGISNPNSFPTSDTGTFANYISYLPYGMSKGSSPTNNDGSINICVGNIQRSIGINSTGRIRFSKGTC